MKYKAVVTDLDGTLLDGNHKITKEAKEGLKLLHDNGIVVILATGRHHINVKKLKKDIGIKSYAISSNGNIVLDEANNILFSHELDENVSKEILLNTEYKKTTHINVYRGDSWLIEREDDHTKEFDAELFGMDFELVEFDKIEDYRLQKIYYVDESHDTLLELEKSILNRFSDRVDAIFSLPTCLEIMPKNINKGAALEDILIKLGIDKGEVIAFGDGFNDYEMLNLVGNPFIMNNAHYKLKNALNEIEIIGDHTENAVIKKLKELFPDILNSLIIK